MKSVSPALMLPQNEDRKQCFHPNNHLLPQLPVQTATNCPVDQN